MRIQYLDMERESDLSIAGMKLYRDYLITTAQRFVNEKFIFCHYGFDITGLYFMDLLQENNVVYFENKDHFIYPRLYSSFLNIFRSSFKSFLLKKLLWSYVLGKRFEMFEMRDGSWFLGKTPDGLSNYFSSLSSEQLKSDVSIFAKNQEEVVKAFEIPAFDILYIDDGATAVYDARGIESLLRALKNDGYSIAVKHHPSHPQTFSSNEFHSLPEYLPVELLSAMAKVANIGVLSTALLIACNYRKTYSLVNMVPILSESQKGIIMNLFSNYPIIYPKREDDLLEKLNA